jgi:hypothetical protein
VGSDVVTKVDSDVDLETYMMRSFIVPPTWPTCL